MQQPTPDKFDSEHWVKRQTENSQSDNSTTAITVEAQLAGRGTESVS